MNEYEIEVERIILLIKEYMTNLSYQNFNSYYQDILLKKITIRQISEMYIFHKLFRENQINFYIK